MPRLRRFVGDKTLPDLASPWRGVVEPHFFFSTIPPGQRRHSTSVPRDIVHGISTREHSSLRVSMGDLDSGESFTALTFWCPGISTSFLETLVAVDLEKRVGPAHAEKSGSLALGILESRDTWRLFLDFYLTLGRHSPETSPIIFLRQYQCYPDPVGSLSRTSSNPPRSTFRS